MYKNCLYCTTIFAIDSMFDSTLCNRRGHDLQTHVRFVRETRTDHVKRSMSPLHFWEQHELHAYFKDLTCEVMFRNDPVLTCLNIFQFPLVTCLRYWIRWCPEKLRRRFQQKKQHRTSPSRQSLRDLQDSDELEKLFKPYASRNKASPPFGLAGMSTWDDVKIPS